MLVQFYLEGDKKGVQGSHEWFPRIGNSQAKHEQGIFYTFCQH